MIKLDDDLLKELGLGNLPPEEKKKLLAHIYETLEMRVGMKLAEQMSDAQLSEFEQFIDSNNEAGALQWLEANFPNYKDVVAAEFEKLKAEIAQVAPQIAAAAQQAAAVAAQAGGYLQQQAPQAVPGVQPQQFGAYPPQNSTSMPQQPVHTPQPPQQPYPPQYQQPPIPPQGVPAPLAPPQPGEQKQDDYGLAG